VQDVPLARLRAHQGREQIVFRHLQLVRFASVRFGHQDRFLGPGRQAEEDAEVDVLFTRAFSDGALFGGRGIAPSGFWYGGLAFLSLCMLDDAHEAYACMIKWFQTTAWDSHAGHAVSCTYSKRTIEETDYA
jgi:hypothetical protein